MEEFGQVGEPIAQGRVLLFELADESFELVERRRRSLRERFALARCFAELRKRRLDFLHRLLESFPFGGVERIGARELLVESGEGFVQLSNDHVA